MFPRRVPEVFTRKQLHDKRNRDTHPVLVWGPLTEKGEELRLKG